jgi:hypothetical protein
MLGPQPLGTVNVSSDLSAIGGSLAIGAGTCQMAIINFAVAEIYKFYGFRVLGQGLRAVFQGAAIGSLRIRGSW